MVIDQSPQGDEINLLWFLVPIRHRTLLSAQVRVPSRAGTLKGLECDLLVVFLISGLEQNT